MGARFAYTLELRGPGFILGKENVTPAGEETWAGFKVMFRKMMKLSDKAK